ncbi:38k [Erannis ankeraria nucleopolyhedrovirus]|uniref:38k n=1 Tax=Erannis ankeraria nucleopolyhedrovirus TaxID=2913600 RepID=UPI0024820734|nr:38k [Erannis ankeraria nucleopolyhedrovirus]UJZ89010.1 38k [Erannis ankeraria nucleopolyhedrovirus]
MFEFILFSIDKTDTNSKVDLHNYFMQIIKCDDKMNDIRYNIKTIYKTSALGHTYVINECVPMYSLLNEWYVQNHMEIYQLKQDTFVWEIPHAIVFDLDSTLITDEFNVRIRSRDVYNSLLELKSKGHLLILWSYGNEEHVSHSMKITNLTNFFDIVICKGYKTGDIDKGIIVDQKNDLIFVKKPFYLDIEDGDRLPKSPRVVLWHLRKIGVNFVKSLTLVDDLKANNYAYDYFVNVKKSPEPKDDWQQYHEIILDNIHSHDAQFI